MTIKLALLGQNISHSQSQKMYEGVLKRSIEYGLLDFDNPNEIPSLEKIFNQYQGFSITSPYKQHFLEEVKLQGKSKEIGAINCIRQVKSGEYEGINTDYNAVKEITSNLIDKYGQLNIAVFGDGVMSKVNALVLDELSIPYKIYSRKIGDDIASFDVAEHRIKPDETLLIINSCSREFKYEGQGGLEAIFWDQNYNLAHHQDVLPNKFHTYFDGTDLLQIQAIHALKFWGIC